MTVPGEPPPDLPSWQPLAVFEVLFVCTGNVCRSPFAEALARRLLLDRIGPVAASGFAFGSAGTRATPGRPMHPETRAALGVWGVHVAESGPAAFAARQLDERMVQRADLILTADEGHRSAIAWMCGDALPKVYGMRRFARMLAMLDQSRLPADPVHRALRITERAPRLHAVVGPLPPQEEAIPDPIGAGPQVHLHVGDLVFEVVAAFVDVVAPV